MWERLYVRFFHTPDCDISMLLLGYSPQLQLKYGGITLTRRRLIQNLQELIRNSKRDWLPNVDQVEPETVVQLPSATSCRMTLVLFIQAPCLDPEPRVQ